MNRESYAKALRLRMYVLCSECARIIDIVEGNRQQRDLDAKDLVRTLPRNMPVDSKCLASTKHEPIPLRLRGKRTVLVVSRKERINYTRRPSWILCGKLST